MNQLQQQRIAIAAIFFMNGFGFANLMARLPEIQVHFGMSNAILGATLFCRAAGALVAMPFTARLGAQFSSGRITRAMGLSMAVFLPLLVSMPSIWPFALVFFLFGMSEGVLDVNMNEQAVLIERGYGKPIMSSFHAVFSGGMAIGAGCGVLMAHYQVPLFLHYVMVGVICLTLVLLSSGYFVQTPKIKHYEKDQPMFLLPSKAILPLGIIALCAMTGEGTMSDWSAVYMKQILQQTDSFAGFALAAFNLAMFIGRATGDVLHRKMGQKMLLLADSTASVFGLVVVLTVSSPSLALAGFFIIGLGLSTIVPIIYSAAGNTEGVSPSVGIAMATSIGYAGFFVGPPVIGYLAEAFDLRIGLLFTLLLFIGMWFLVLRRR